MLEEIAAIISCSYFEIHFIGSLLICSSVPFSFLLLLFHERIKCFQ